MHPNERSSYHVTESVPIQDTVRFPAGLAVRQGAVEAAGEGATPLTLTSPISSPSALTCRRQWWTLQGHAHLHASLESNPPKSLHRRGGAQPAANWPKPRPRDSQ